MRQKRYWLFSFGLVSFGVAAYLAGVLVNTPGNDILKLAVVSTMAFGFIGAMERYIELDDKVNKMEERKNEKSN